MYIKVRVFAGAKKEEFTQISSDHFKIVVREKPERNLANRRVAELLADYFKTTFASIRLVSGHHSPSKIFSVPNIK
jgi:uncharacterized protein YggU (UPF0235/DUF167 family)